MVYIALKPQCLRCDHVEIVNNVGRFTSVLDGHRFSNGTITCSHIGTCERMGDEPSISEIIGQLANLEGGE